MPRGARSFSFICILFRCLRASTEENNKTLPNVCIHVMISFFVKIQFCFLSLLCSSIEVTGFFVVALWWINNDNNYGFDFGLVKCLTKKPLMAYIRKNKFISLWFVFKLSTQTTQNNKMKKRSTITKKKEPWTM